MNFDIYGPFEMKVDKLKHGRVIASNAWAEMKATIDNEALIAGCGCYVFALKTTRGYKPWYVGQAAKTRLLWEALNPRNKTIYTEVIAGNSGSPVLFLIPKLTPGGAFAAPTTRKAGLRAVDFLEDWMIAKALKRNPDLVNTHSTHFLKNLYVRGLYNAKPGKDTIAAHALKRAIL